MKLWWQLCASWFREHKARSAAALFAALSTVFAGVGLLTVAGWFLTGAFLSGSLILFNLFVPSALVRGLSMWRIVSRYLERITGHTVTLDLQAEIRAQTFEQLSQLPAAELARYRDGDLVARLINDVERLDSVFLLLIVPAFTALTGGVLYSIFVGSHVPWAGIAVLACVLIGVVAAPYWVARRSARLGLDVTDKVSQLRALLHDAMVAHVDIVVFNGFRSLQHSFEAQSAELSAQRTRMAAMASLGNLTQQVGMGLLLITMVLTGLHTYHEYELSAAIWVGLLLGALGLFEVMAPLMRGASSLGVASSAAARLQTLRANVSDEKHDTQERALPTTGALCLDGLSVGYEHNAALLSNINLSVAQGERVLIRGLSGAGKSTLLHTIMGVTPSLAGQIRYGDVDLDDISTAQRFRQFTLMSQHSTVFMGSLRHNLLLAKPDATDAELWSALERVRLDEFVNRLASGLDSWVGEGGNTLSTGQKRRLCLARILLTSASLWVLDEPLSGLDEATAYALLRDLLQFAEKRTIIMVSHEPVPSGLFHREMQIIGEQLYDIPA